MGHFLTFFVQQKTGHFSAARLFRVYVFLRTVVDYYLSIKKDARNNLILLPKTGADDSDELIYFTAAVVIIYNPAKQYQRHYLEHTDDIKW